MSVMRDYKYLRGTKRRRAIRGYMVAAAQWAAVAAGSLVLAAGFVGWLIVVSP